MTTNRRIFYLHDITSTLGTFLTYNMLFLYLKNFIMSDSSLDILGMSLIALILVIDVIARIFTSNVVIYIMLHLLPFAGLFMPTMSIYNCIAIFIMASYIFVNSINYWKSEDISKDLHSITLPGEMVIFYAIIFIHSYYGLSKNFTIYVYVAGVLFYALSLINKYFDRIILNKQSALGTNKEHPDSIYTLNSALVGIFIAFVVLVIIGICLVFSENSFNFIGSGLKYLATLIITLLMRMKSDDIKNNDIDDAGSVVSNGGQFTEITASDNPIADALFLIMQIVIYVLIFAGIAYTLYTFFKKYMYRSRISTDEIKKIENDTEIKDIKRRTRSFSFKDLFATLSNNDKVRKLYFKRINELTDTTFAIRNSLTPDEISLSVKSNKGVSIDELSEIYKLARYSDKIITKEDVERCKNN